MRPSSSKAKGRTFQQWVRDLLISLAPSLETDDIKSTSMGAPGEDIQLSPAARKVFPFSIECKSYASMAFYKWYEQAKANTKPGLEPLVVAKANRKNPVVIVDAKWFFTNFINKVAP